ncbi:unnamed protein product [Amoebophrya sp. A25]|nr:unnamed protein product [Amoebophrya sp. A25]|eukprot:GSA25T00002413001.1
MSIQKTIHYGVGGASHVAETPVEDMLTGDARQETLWIGPERKPDESNSEGPIEWKGPTGGAVMSGGAVASSGPREATESANQVQERFLTSQAQWLLKRKYKQEVRNAEAELERMKECVFRPNRQGSAKGGIKGGGSGVHINMLGNSTSAGGHAGVSPLNNSSRSLNHVELHEGGHYGVGDREHDPEDRSTASASMNNRNNHRTTAMTHHNVLGATRKTSPGGGADAGGPVSLSGNVVGGSMQHGGSSSSTANLMRKNRNNFLYQLEMAQRSDLHSIAGTTPIQPDDPSLKVPDNNYEVASKYLEISAHSGLSYIEARKAEAEAARQRQEALEMAECTFQPDLRQSQKSYKCYRSCFWDESKHLIMLGQQKEDGDVSTSSSTPEGMLAAGAIIDGRKGGLGIVDSETEERLLQSRVAARSRVREQRMRAKVLSSNENQNMTFHPMVNDIPDEMKAARIYLSEDVFKRLSMPNHEIHNSSTSDAGRGGRTGGGSQMNLVGGGGAHLAAAGGGGDVGASMLTGDAGASFVSESAKREIYHSFLMRQNEKQFEKEANMDELEKKYAIHPHQPRLNTRSRRLAATNQKRSSYLRGTDTGAALAQAATGGAQQGGVKWNQVYPGGSGGGRGSTSFGSIHQETTDDDVLNAIDVRRTCYGDIAGDQHGSFLMGRSLHYNAVRARTSQQLSGAGAGPSGISLGGGGHPRASNGGDAPPPRSRAAETVTECTFAPRINPKSQTLAKRRSLEELSVGDLDRRRERVKQISQRLEQKQEKELETTKYVRPDLGAVTRAYDTVPAKTQAYRSYYVEQLREKQQEQDRKRDEERWKRQQSELRECRFQPDVEKSEKSFKREFGPGRRVFNSALLESVLLEGGQFPSGKGDEVDGARALLLQRAAASKNSNESNHAGSFADAPTAASMKGTTVSGSSASGRPEPPPLETVMEPA